MPHLGGVPPKTYLGGHVVIIRSVTVLLSDFDTSETNFVKPCAREPFLEQFGLYGVNVALVQL